MRHFLCKILLLLFLAFFQCRMSADLMEGSLLLGLKDDSEESVPFCDMNIDLTSLETLQSYSYESNRSFGDCMAAAMVLHRFHISQNSNLKSENLSHTITLLKEKKPAAYQRLSEAYDTIFADIRYFPLAKQKQAGHSRQFFFENSYGDMRSYGGNRTHEGTDIFGIHTAPGIYPIISVSDGIIENIGWLPLGGYRIGIRSPHGCYFYYAHLASYEQNFKEGDMVRAGEILGLMGDTGYGDEGMRGRFPTHLHFGIYISTRNVDELAINPYPVLLLLEKHTKEYQY